MLKLRFKQNRIGHWASRYSYSRSEEDIAELGRRIRRRGFMTNEELLQFFDWKTGGRGRSRCLKNSHSYVKELTGISFGTKEDRLRIEILTLLDGVQWPVASAILHFVFPDQCPILDFRALWSLGMETPPAYNYPFWKAYGDTCRTLAQANNVDLRILDRALWQYSKEKQNG